MIQKIIFPDNYRSSQIMFFKQTDLNKMTNPNIIPLFGPNGIGKSTFIKAVIITLELEKLREKYKTDPDKEYYYKQFERDEEKQGCQLILNDRPFQKMSYINTKQNFKNVHNSFNPVILNAKWDANQLSEGQSIIYSIFNLFEILKKENSDTKDIIVLIDELDSGMSIDNLDMCMRKIKNITRKHKNIQIIFSFNNPRILKFFPEVLSLYDGNPVTLHDADEMLLEMNQHKKEFNKKRRKSNGMPKVPN